MRANRLVASVSRPGAGRAVGPGRAGRPGEVQTEYALGWFPGCSLLSVGRSSSVGLAVNGHLWSPVIAGDPQARAAGPTGIGFTRSLPAGQPEVGELARSTSSHAV